MRSLYSKVFKNNQVCVGVPFQLRIPPQFQHLAAVMEEAAACAEPGTSQGDDETLRIQAQEEADLIVREAELEAERIVKAALQKAAGIREEAKACAYEEGLKEIKMQYQSMLDEAEEVRHESERHHREMLEEMESEIVDLALEIARKVIGSEITQNRNAILQIAKQALVRCSNKENAVLRLSSLDHEYVEQNREEFLAMDIGALDIEIRKDCSMKPGGCAVDTTFGSVDAGVDTRLGQIEQEFKQALGK